MREILSLSSQQEEMTCTRESKILDLGISQKHLKSHHPIASSLLRDYAKPNPCLSTSSPITWTW